MKRFDVHYELTIRGSIEVEAEDEAEAEEKVVEDMEYDKLAENGGLPDIEAEAYEIKTVDGARRQLEES